ncbi:MAG TPA: Na+/H+ antiporter [Candidatus Cybelea sp.]|jgi:CPA1 family monovalent cation:H+ antiporter
MTAIIVVFLAIIVLVTIANRIGVAYPIVLVLGGMAIGFIPGVPTIQFTPDLVLLVFLPPLLYWESVTAPTSEFRAGALWIFQMAFGLVIVTTVAVAVVAHAIVPGMSWGVAFVLGAIVSSTDEVAFSAIGDQLNVPRHIIGTIEGESLVNDATSLILYGVGIAAVVGASFSLVHAAGALALAIIESVLIGLAAAALAGLAWRALKDETLQATISVVVPFLSYLPAYYLGASGVLATVTTGLAVSKFSPVVLQPRAREMLTGFWVTVVFLLNAFIFTEVGIQFRSIVAGLGHYPLAQLVWWGVAVALVCILVRIVWTFAQGLLPATNEPEHVEGKADWSHVFLLAWTGMRGGVSLAAALAIPLETVAGPFPYRDLLIFITFVVLLVTLVGQGGALPWVIRWMKIKDDGTSLREERLAIIVTARAGLKRLDQLERTGVYPPLVMHMHRERLEARLAEFTSPAAKERAADTAAFRQSYNEILAAERGRLIELRKLGKIDNTVLRQVQRLLDLETLEVQYLDSTGHTELEE